VCVFAFVFVFVCVCVGVGVGVGVGLLTVTVWVDPRRPNPTNPAQFKPNQTKPQVLSHRPAPGAAGGPLHVRSLLQPAVAGGERQGVPPLLRRLQADAGDPAQHARGWVLGGLGVGAGVLWLRRSVVG